jgi:hypothetical protein
MTASPHDESCPICKYWTDRASEHAKRALAGDTASYRKERRAQQELAEHLSRDTRTAAQSVEVRV